MSHKLKEWRKAHGVTAEALAAKVNRLPRQIYRWEDGTCIPEPPVIAELEKITNGEVTFPDWFPRATPPTEARAGE